MSGLPSVHCLIIILYNCTVTASWNVTVHVTVTVTVTVTVITLMMILMPMIPYMIIIIGSRQTGCVITSYVSVPDLDTTPILPGV